MLLIVRYETMQWLQRLTRRLSVWTEVRRPAMLCPPFLQVEALPDKENKSENKICEGAVPLAVEER